METYVVIIERGSEEDMAVIVKATDEGRAADLAWSWADDQKIPTSDVWTSGDLAAVEDSWGTLGPEVARIN